MFCTLKQNMTKLFGIFTVKREVPMIQLFQLGKNFYVQQNLKNLWKYIRIKMATITFIWEIPFLLGLQKNLGTNKFRILTDTIIVLCQHK